MSVTIWKQLALCRGTDELFLKWQRHLDGGSAQHLTRPCHFRKFRLDFFPFHAHFNIKAHFNVEIVFTCVSFVVCIRLWIFLCHYIHLTMCYTDWAEQANIHSRDWHFNTLTYLTHDGPTRTQSAQLLTQKSFYTVWCQVHIVSTNQCVI